MSAWLEKTMQRAVKAHQQGKLAEAAAGYQQVLAKAPRNPDALHLLGLLAYQRRDYGQAVKCIRNAIANQARQPLFHFNLGKVLRDAGDPAGAVGAYREALRLAPDYLEALGNLGNVLQETGQTEAAIEAFLILVQRLPNDPNAWNQLGVAYSESCEFDRSRQALERALAIDPNHLQALYNYAGMAIKAGQLDDAQALLQRVLALAPDLPEAHLRQAAVWNARQRAVLAEPCLRQALRLNPGLEEAWLALGHLLASQGAPQEEIAAAFRAAGSTCRPDILQLIEALRVPAILSDDTEVAAIRQALADQLARLAETGLSLEDPVREIGKAMLFHLAYHGRDDRKIYESVAAIFRRACPSLEYIAPHCQAPRPQQSGRRPRVGFISGFFCDHTIGNLFKDLLAGFDRSRLEIFALFAPGPRDGVSRAVAEACENALEIKPDLELARSQIAALELDALCYLDVGMDPFTYFLAYARLAPLQCVTWGHPVTTGLPQMDVFLSSRRQERQDAQSDYSERLVCLEDPLYVFPRPRRADTQAAKGDFGFADTRLYLCPQSLFKLVPQFDPVLADILRRDPLARIAIPEGNFKQWRSTLEQRWRRSMPDVAERIVFFERLDPERYLDFTAVADVVLDSLPFGGGLTTLNTLAVGTPIVTLPGPLMSSRFTAACYRRMGLESCIASTPAEYAELAVRIATSPEQRARIRADILARNDVLFDNPAVVKELETWLVEQLA